MKVFVISPHFQLKNHLNGKYTPKFFKTLSQYSWVLSVCASRLEVAK